jgi:hypothetical protein
MLIVFLQPDYSFTAQLPLDQTACKDPQAKYNSLLIYSELFYKRFMLPINPLSLSPETLFHVKLSLSYFERPSFRE